MTMEKKKTLTPLMTSTAGAINGLLVGVIAEEARIRYLNYQMGQAARQYARTDWAVDFVDVYRRPLVPFICVLSFLDLRENPLHPRSSAFSLNHFIAA